MWTECRYDPDRLAGEWKEARWQAISPFVKGPIRESNEFDWIHAVRPGDRDAVLSAIAEAGRGLGKKVRREIGEEPTLGEIVYLMSRAGIHCFQGEWRSAEHGLAREHCRDSCPFVEGEYDCDYWREAARGLVSGLSDSIAFARHASIGHDSEGCADVLYCSPVLDQKYGPIPPDVATAVDSVVENLNRWKVTLELVGFNEGTLYFRLVGQHFPVCESCRRLVSSELLRALATVEPAVKLCEIASEPVLPGTEPVEPPAKVRSVAGGGLVGFLRRRS